MVRPHRDKSRPNEDKLGQGSGFMRYASQWVQSMTAARVVSDPNIMLGKPIVEGTRITVELILEKLAAGETVEQLVAAHPRLSEQGVRAALAFAAKVLRNDIVYPIDEENAA